MCWGGFVAPGVTGKGVGSVKKGGRCQPRNFRYEKHGKFSKESMFLKIGSIFEISMSNVQVVWSLYGEICQVVHGVQNSEA